MSGHALAFGLLLVPAGRVGDARGRRPAFTAGLAGFRGRERGVRPGPVHRLADRGPSGAGSCGRQVNARYVVGADGMHSTVRDATGIGFTGGRYPQSFMLAGVRFDWPLPPQEVQLFLAAQRLVVVAPLHGGHHRVVGTADTAPENADEPYLQALLDQRGPGRSSVREALWSSRSRVHHRVADTYRAGPLTQVLREPAPQTALDGYTGRRRPAALRLVTLTDRATRAAAFTSPTVRAAGNTALLSETQDRGGVGPHGRPSSRSATGRRRGWSARRPGRPAAGRCWDDGGSATRVIHWAG